MAYEKEIKAGLKNKFHKDLGLNDSTYEKVANILGATTTTEDQVETVVSGAEGWLKIVQSEADIVRKNKPTPTPPTPPTPPQPNPNQTELEKLIADAIGKASAPLIEKISTLEKANTAKTTRENLIARLTEKKIDPSFYETAIEGREFGSDDEINTFVEKISGSFDKFNQSQADKGLLSVPKPILGEPNKEGISAATQSYIESKAADVKNPLGGKAL